MSRHLAFRRQPVPQQFAQQQQARTFPAPNRGLIESENEAFMAPGGAMVLDNWVPTMRGLKLRGGTVRYCDLHALDATVPPVPSPLRNPVISAFEYVSGTSIRMFAAQQTKLFDVTATTPVLVKSGQTSGNYAAAQLSNAAGYWLLAVNETGDPVLRYNGSTWQSLDTSTIAAWVNNTAYAIGATARDTADGSFWRCLVAHTSAAAGTFAANRTANPTYWTSTAADGPAWITGPVGSPVEFGKNLSFVWKYRNRMFFIQAGSMDAWYLGIDSIGGSLLKIPLSGAATRGGYLLFGASWSLDAGDGIDDKCVFVTSLGEVLIFTGTNPADPNNWRQEGRYFLSPPMGMNAFTSIGGDLIILTVDGIVPLSQAITKDSGQLELAMLSRDIKQSWRETVLAKRSKPWTIRKWDEYGVFLVATPGGTGLERRCFAANNATGAWCRLTFDATCWARLGGDMFFGNQDGIIMQCERTGKDDGAAYVATMVGGWETFSAPTQQVVWHQARAVFVSPAFEPFLPQLSATTDFVVTIPPPPPPGLDPALLDVWDQGLWDVAKWDQPGATRPAHRNTLWISIGMTGFAHAPICQVTVAQQAVPQVELMAISASYEVAGVTV